MSAELLTVYIAYIDGTSSIFYLTLDDYKIGRQWVIEKRNNILGMGIIKPKAFIPGY